MRVFVPPFFFRGSAGRVTGATTPIPRRGLPPDKEPFAPQIRIQDLFRYSMRVASVRVEASVNVTIPGTGTYQAAGSFVAKRLRPFGGMFSDESSNDEQEPIRIRDMMVAVAYRFPYPSVTGKVLGTFTPESPPDDPNPPQPEPYEAQVSFGFAGGDLTFDGLYFNPKEYKYQASGFNAQVSPVGEGIRGEFLGIKYETKSLTEGGPGQSVTLNISMDGQPDMEF